MSERVRAPELDAGLGWLNTDRPLRLGHELRGQVVVLDFWTYCCINCMHILPDLAFLEHKYREEPVAFIGVHSAKFTNEATRQTIRAAVLRYEIQHPVVIDDNMKTWRRYSVRSWPTLVVIDATRHVVCVAPGEGNRDLIDRAVAQALQQGRAGGTLADGPLKLRREAGVRSASGLSFPGKVLVDEQEGRLYVADSNHNRIVVAERPDAAGRSRVIKVVGSGAIGADDGAFDKATFSHPQGLAVGHGILYVADTENHLIRAIDPSSFEVSTVVGTGEMSNDRAGGGMGTQQGLNSPWDLALEGSTLYVAMAGLHQIWRIDFPVGFARALAGSGRENIVDGPNETAALAQPSGLCIAGGKLFFADSEVSAIRVIDPTSERVSTIIGDGLFSFGDVDGTHPEAKLQHPLGVDAWGSSLVVADTYNHKIKLVDPAARSARTLFGTGKTGAFTPDGKVEFFEPGGLSVAGDHLYVADTNNHRVVGINLRTKQWQEIIFDGLSAPRAEESPLCDVIAAAPVSVDAKCAVQLVLDIELPARSHISPEAPWSVRVASDGATIAQQTGRSDSLPLRITVPASSVKAGNSWDVAAAFAYCTDDDRGLCVPLHLAWKVPVRAGGTASDVTLGAKICAD